MIVCDNSDVRRPAAAAPRATRAGGCSPHARRTRGRRTPPDMPCTPPPVAPSQWMRNGDFAPSRLEAQQDAVNLLAGAKTQSNPENTVGVLTMAGKGVEVRVAMTSDVGKVLAQSHGAQVCGEINLSAGLQVAGLALKHRQNKNQRQRIIVFVGSPVKEEEKELFKGKRRHA